MTSQAYIERVLAVGYNVHFNDGVWWIERAPFFYVPVIPYQVLDRGSAKPKMHKALLGYRHNVSNEQDANTYDSTMLLNEERLKTFGMQSLSRDRRKKVKKALRLTEVRKIETVETVIDDMKEILISKAIRTRHGKPPEYYVKHDKEWRAWSIKQFYADKGKKEYWGAFYDNSLIAYMTLYQIDDTVTLSTLASHTDHLDKCPNDALYFAILDYFKDVKDCKRVVSGGWSDKQSLNEYKQTYGFEKVDLPVYVKYNFPILNKLMTMRQLRQFRNLIESYIIKWGK